MGHYVRSRVLTLLLLASLTGWAENTTVTIVHTTDINGFWGEKPDSTGGFLRSAYTIDKLHGLGEHSLILDAGGSAPLDDEALVKAGYESVLVSTADFLHKSSPLIKRLQNPKLRFLGANLRHNQQRGTPFSSFYIKRWDNCTLAVVGLCDENMPQDLLPAFLNPFYMEDAEKTLTRLLPTIQFEQPDATLLVYRGSLARLRKILARFPIFDVVIGGGQDKEIEGYYIGQALYTHAGKKGRSVGEVTLHIDTTENKVVEKKSRLHPMASHIPRKEYDLPHLTYQDQVHAPFKPSEIADKLMEKTGADFVLLNEEPLYPVRYLCSLHVMPHEIRPIVEDILQHRSSTFAATFYGLNIVHQEGDIRLAMENTGETLHTRKRYHLVTTSDLAASAGGKLPHLRACVDVPRCRFTLTNQSWSQIIHALMENE